MDNLDDFVGNFIENGMTGLFDRSRSVDDSLSLNKKKNAFSSNNVPQLPSDYKPFRIEKDVISKKVRECIIGNDTHENVQISDQTRVRVVRNNSNANLTTKLGIEHSP